MDDTNLLPIETITYLLSFVDDIFTCSRVCRLFYNIIYHPSFAKIYLPRFIPYLIQYGYLRLIGSFLPIKKYSPILISKIRDAIKLNI